MVSANNPEIFMIGRHGQGVDYRYRTQPRPSDDTRELSMKCSTHSGLLEPTEQGWSLAGTLSKGFVNAPSQSYRKR